MTGIEKAVHLVMSLMVSHLSFFPRDVLDEIWDCMESVSENFSTFSSILKEKNVLLKEKNLFFKS